MSATHTTQRRLYVVEVKDESLLLHELRSILSRPKQNEKHNGQVS